MPAGDLRYADPQQAGCLSVYQSTGAVPIDNQQTQR
jgi:hypothetical protein